MEENRDSLLDQGYISLQNGLWQEAKQTFDIILQNDSECCLAFLGIAMAEKQIHCREELGKNWEGLQKDPDFEKFLHSMPPDFLRWLQQDMASLQNKNKLSEEALDFSALDPGRKLLLIFTGIQILFFCLIMYSAYHTFPEKDTFPSELMTCFMIALILAGAPVILGPVYGNSILKSGRFCKFLKVINNIMGYGGCGFYSLFLWMYAPAWAGKTEAAFYDRYNFCVFFFCVCIDLLTLIFPGILRKVKENL